MQYLVMLHAPVHFKRLPLGTVGVAIHPVVVTAADDDEAHQVAQRVSSLVKESKVLAVERL
jgi:hypothetical protein